MAVPKRKTSPSKRGKRRSHKGLKLVNVVVNSTTGEHVLPHTMSLKDGYYNGKKILLTRDELTESK